MARPLGGTCWPGCWSAASAGRRLESAWSNSKPAVRELATHHPIAASVPGIVLTASSVVIMPALGITKQRLGRRLNSGATAGEGIQNLMCAAQAAAVLLGLTVVAVWPAGWTVDPVIALGIAA